MISAEVASHALWHYGYGGMKPGSFTISLMETIARADQANRYRLYLAFPQYVLAATLAESSRAGIGALNYIANFSTMDEGTMESETEPRIEGQIQHDERDRT